jgi:hypothetical protein
MAANVGRKGVAVYSEKGFGSLGSETWGLRLFAYRLGIPAAGDWSIRADQMMSNPIRMAFITASVRLLAPSLLKIRLRWLRTVF